MDSEHKSDKSFNKQDVNQIKKSEQKFSNQIYIIIIFILIECIGGYLSKSLAIYCDIGHLISDLAGYSISLYAIKYAQRKAPKNFTFGFKKVENIGALFSVFFTWLICFFIMFQGFYRLYRLYRKEKLEIDAYYMVLSSIFSLGINIIMMFALTHTHDHGHSHFHFHSHSHSNSNSLISSHNHKKIEKSVELKTSENHNELLIKTEPKKEIKKEDHNLQAAFIHILGDMVQSLGVVIAAITLYYHPKLIIIDPLISIFFSIIAFSFTLPITYSILRFLVDMTPKYLDIEEIENLLLNVTYVKKLHNLHLWGLNNEESVLSVHLVVDEDGKENYVRSKVMGICKEFGIKEFTVQVESEISELYHNCEKEHSF